MIRRTFFFGSRIAAGLLWSNFKKKMEFFFFLEVAGNRKTAIKKVFFLYFFKEPGGIRKSLLLVWNPDEQYHEYEDIRRRCVDAALAQSLPVRTQGIV